MWPDRVSNPGHLTYESGAPPTKLRGPASDMKVCYVVSLESAYRGDSNEYTQQTIININRKITKIIPNPLFIMFAAMGYFC